MELNYIILAHENPYQLSRLAKRLDAKGVCFYIHIDRNVCLEPFKAALYEKKNVFFLEGKQRERGVWGDLGIVKGTINALKQIIEDQRSGYCILLSGQDYPLKQPAYIQKFFEESSGKNYITCFKMPGTWGINGVDRITKYKVNKSNERRHFTLLPSVYDKDFYSLKTAGKINYLLKSGQSKIILKLLKKRIFPNYLEPYGGSQWWALPSETITLILEFISNHPDYLRYHQFTLLPDEIFFQSIIMFLKKEHPIKIIPSLMYDNWRRKTGPLPVTFGSQDFEEIKQAGEHKIFARKFDTDTDEVILDIIDETMLSP